MAHDDETNDRKRRHRNDQHREAERGSHHSDVSESQQHHRASHRSEHSKHHKHAHHHHSSSEDRHHSHSGDASKSRHESPYGRRVEIRGRDPSKGRDAASKRSTDGGEQRRPARLADRKSKSNGDLELRSRVDPLASQRSRSRRRRNSEENPRHGKDRRRGSPTKKLIADLDKRQEPRRAEKKDSEMRREVTLVKHDDRGVSRSVKITNVVRTVSTNGRDVLPKKHDSDHKKNDSDTKKYATDTKKHATDTKKYATDTKKNINDIKKPITDVKKHVADQKKNTTDSKNSTADTKKYIIDIKKHITDVKKHAPNDKKLVTDDKKRGTDDKKLVVNDKKHVNNDKKHVTEDKKHVTEDKKHVTEDKKRVSDDKKHITNDKKRVNDDKKYLEKKSKKSSQKRKKSNENVKKLHKAEAPKKDVKHSDSVNDSGNPKASNKDFDAEINPNHTNLAFPLKPIYEYINDRTQMIEEMFSCLTRQKLQDMLPDSLSNQSRDELKKRCVEHIDLMSKKRIKRLLAGDTNFDISSSGTEDTDSEAEICQPSSHDSLDEQEDNDVASTIASDLDTSEERPNDHIINLLVSSGDDLDMDLNKSYSSKMEVSNDSSERPKVKKRHRRSERERNSSHNNNNNSSHVNDDKESRAKPAIKLGKHVIRITTEDDDLVKVRSKVRRSSGAESARRRHSPKSEVKFRSVPIKYQSTSKGGSRSRSSSRPKPASPTPPAVTPAVEREDSQDFDIMLHADAYISDVSSIEISDDEEDNKKRKTTQNAPESDNEQTDLDILELEMRARAIKAMLNSNQIKQNEIKAKLNT